MSTFSQSLCTWIYLLSISLFMYIISGSFLHKLDMELQYCIISNQICSFCLQDWNTSSDVCEDCKTNQEIIFQDWYITVLEYSRRDNSEYCKLVQCKEAVEQTGLELHWEQTKEDLGPDQRGRGKFWTDDYEQMEAIGLAISRWTWHQKGLR